MDQKKYTSWQDLEYQPKNRSANFRKRFRKKKAFLKLQKYTTQSLDQIYSRSQGDMDQKSRMVG